MTTRPPSHRMQGLLGEFKKLYEGRLAKLKAKECHQAAQLVKDSSVNESLTNYEAQVKVYDSYVKDLSEQNEVLVQTVEQLEAEANSRVTNLEAKLTKAVATAKECNQKAKGFELELQAAVLSKKKHEDVISDIQDRYRRLESRYNDVDDHRSALEHDLHALVTIVSIARRTGRWQLEGVKLRQVDFNRVFGEGTTLKPDAKVQEMTAEINRRGQTINQLQAELGAIRADYDHLLETMQSQSQVTTPTGTTESSSRPITELEINVMKLKSELSAMMISRDCLKQELTSREQHVNTLQREITSQHEELALKTEENRELVENIARLEKEAKQYTEQIYELNGKCDEFERKLYDRTEMLKLEITRRDVQVKSIREEMNKTGEEKRSLEKKISEMDSEHKNTQNELQIMTEKAKRYKSEIDEIQTDMEKAQKAYDSSHLECAQLAAQNARLEAELTSVQEEHMSTANQLDKVSSGMQQLESTTRDQQKNLSEEVVEKQLELSTLRGKVAEYETRLDKAEREGAEQKEQLSSLKEEHASTKSQLYTCEAKLADTERRLEEASEKLASTEAKLEAANIQLQEGRVSFDQQEQVLRQELIKKEEALQDGKSRENNLANKISSLENQLASVSTQLEQANQQAGSSQQTISSLNSTQSELSKKLVSQQELYSKASKELDILKSQDEKLKSDYELLLAQHEERLAENGRLEARIRALQINLQTESDSANQRENTYESEVKQLKLERAKLQEIHSRQEDQCRKLHDKVEMLAEKNRGLVLDNEMKQRQVSELSGDLGERERKCSSQTQEILSLSDQVQRLATEIKQITSTREDLSQSMVAKEDETMKQQDKINSLKQKADQLHQQSRTYEGEVRGLQNQLLQVERKLEQKSNELERLNQTHSKLQSSLAEQQLAISQAKQAQHETKASLQAEIKRLEKLNYEGRHELSNSRNQSEQSEAEAERLRNDNSNLSQKLQQASHEKQELEQSLHKYELELTVSQQKNKTCQQEVASRDAVILKLQEDLDHVEHKYTITLEESNDKQEKLQALKEKLQKQEAENRQLQIQINKQTEEINHQAIAINELKNELEIARSEVQRHLVAIETSQDECRQQRSAHTEETRRYKEDIALIQDQLSVNREEVASLQGELTSQQSLAAEAESIAEQWRNDCEAARQQLSSRGELLSEMEKTLDQAKDEISRLEMAVQQERTKATKCQQQIDTLTQKLAGSQSHAKDVASEVKNLQDLLAECRANVTLKSEEVKKMGKEAKNMVAKIEDTEREVIHREELIDRLTNEISTLQQEMAKSHDKLADYETNTKKLRSKMEQRTAECSNSEDRYRALHREFLAYKEQHQYDNQEMNEKDERLRQLEDELQGTSIDLSEKNRQLLAIREEQAIQKCSIGCLQDKMAEAEGEVSRLELTLKETREELDKTRQSFHSEVVQLESTISGLDRDLSVEKEAAEHLGKELEARDELLHLNTSECQALQEQLAQKQEEVNSLGEQVRLLRVDVADREKREAYAQNLISQLHIDVDRVKADITESRAECKGYAQELAHHEEKRLLLEQTLLTTKDQLKQRVTDNVKQEQTISRLQTDMTAVQDQNVQLEHEYGEVKQLVDRLECELNAKTKERDNALEKESSTKLSLQRVQNDLVQSEDRYRRLDAKYVELDGKLQDSHTEHMKEQQRCRELDRLLTNYKSVITELQDDVEQLTKQHKTAADNVKDRESLLKRRCDELDSLTAKLMVTKESLVEKEGQLRIALINLETCEREKGSALQRLEHCETDYHQTAEQRDHLHEQLKQLEAAAREKDRELSRIKSDISSLQSNLNETIDQLNEKSRLTKELKSQLNQSEKLNQELGDEVATLEKKVKSMKHDIKKLQEYNSAAKTDLEKYEQQFRLMHDEVQGQTDRNKQAVEELALKEEELVVAKVEAATLSERLSSKCQDLERTEEELRSVRNSHRVATEEVQALQNALDDARSNGDRLHKESEQVVRNVNGWVDEQKRANEKLASKLREQSDTIRHLQSEKKTLTEDLQSAVNKTRQLEALNAELRTEQLKLQSLQDHSSRQQTLLRQLQQKLEEYEQAQDADLQSKLATIDDLQRQLQINTDNSNLLNSQISMLQKQNSQIRADLEGEVANRHTLAATIGQKDDLIRTLRGQSASLRGSISTRTRSPTRARSPSRNGSINEDSTSSLDKSYWIQRVGELSMQLQQSSEYWSEKVGNLQAQLENK